jgi:hypothetical protein
LVSSALILSVVRTRVVIVIVVVYIVRVIIVVVFRRGLRWGMTVICGSFSE